MDAEFWSTLIKGLINETANLRIASFTVCYIVPFKFYVILNLYKLQIHLFYLLLRKNKQKRISENDIKVTRRILISGFFT